MKKNLIIHEFETSVQDRLRRNGALNDHASPSRSFNAQPNNPSKATFDDFISNLMES